MNNNRTHEERDVIPRWREFKRTANIGELNSIYLPVNNEPSEPSFQLKHSYEVWENDRDYLSAIDLINNAFVEQKYDLAIDAAKQILNEKKELGYPLNDIVSKIINRKVEVDYIEEVIDDRQHYAQISKYKKYLINNPSDSIAWTELARNYAILNIKEKANRSLDIALSLNRNNRYIVRSAVNYYYNLGDYDKAYYSVTNALDFSHDPMLLSAEISLNILKKKSSRHTKNARRMLNSKTINGMLLTELASSLGTLELLMGSLKKAKKLFLQSLINANDNTLAQALWVNENYRLINDESALAPASYTKIPYSYEAQVYFSRNNSNWNDAMKWIEKWKIDQPFDVRPYIEASYISAVGLSDYDKSIDYAKMGLKKFPNDLTLINNYVFSSLKRGDLENLTNYIKMMERYDKPEHEITYLATLGLLEYKVGNRESGQELYKKAISLSKEKGLIRMMNMGMLYQAQEEVSYSDEISEEIIAKALDISEKVEIPDVQAERLRLLYVH